VGQPERPLLRRWRPTQLALAVQGRYKELNGRELSLAITLSAFLSILPLLLVGIAVFGFFSAAASKDLAVEAVQRLGLDRSSDTARLITEAMHTAESSRKAASVVGLAGLLWTGLGVVRSLQYAWNTAWQVRGRGLRDKAVGVVWLGGAALLFAGSFVLSAVSQLLPWYLAPLGILAGLATGVGLWLWTAHTLPNRRVGWRPLLPGAIIGAIGFEILKVGASFVVPRFVASSSDLYGPVGVVFALLAWLLLFGRLVVFTAVVEVVLWEERHGTVELTIEAPARPGIEPLSATRAGQQRFPGPPEGAALPLIRRNGDGLRISGRRSDPTGPGVGGRPPTREAEH
jgi:membrane protein